MEKIIMSEVSGENLPTQNIEIIKSELVNVRKQAKSLFKTFPNSDMNNEDVIVAGSLSSLHQNTKIPSEVLRILEEEKIGNPNYIIWFAEPVFISSLRFKKERLQTNAKLKLFQNDFFLIENKNGDLTSKKAPSNYQSKSENLAFTMDINSIVHGIVITNTISLITLKYISLSRILHSKLTETLIQSFENVDFEISIALQNIKEFEDSIALNVNQKTSQLDMLSKKLKAFEDESIRVEEDNESKKSISNKLDQDLEVNGNKLKKKKIEEQSLLEKIQVKKVELETVERKIENKTEENIRVEKTIITYQTTLKKLNAEIQNAEKEKNIYSFDMKGFTKEARNQLNIYIGLISILIISLCGIFSYIYSNAKEYQDLLPDLKYVNMFDIFLSRLPMVTASTLIIGALSALLYFLVNHVISLNKEKMLMLKAHILAEQLSHSLEDHCEKVNLDPILLKKELKVDFMMKFFEKDKIKENPNNTDIKIDKGMIDTLSKILEEAKK